LAIIFKIVRRRVASFFVFGDSSKVLHKYTGYVWFIGFRWL